MQHDAPDSQRRRIWTWLLVLTAAVALCTQTPANAAAPTPPACAARACGADLDLGPVLWILRDDIGVFRCSSGRYERKI
jgi:hypothetical protein